MATFDGELLSIQLDVNILAAEDFSLSQVDLLGECMDSANVVAGFRLPVSAKTRVVSEFLAPAEQRGGTHGPLSLPVEFQTTTLVERFFRLSVRSFEEVAAPFQLPVEFSGATVLHCVQYVPVEARASVDADQRLPVEFVTMVAAAFFLPAEAAAGVAAPQQMPSEAAGTTVVVIPFGLPVDAPGGFHAPQQLPMESAGLIVINAAQFVPLEALGAVAAVFRPVLEASGEELAVLVHRRNIFVRLFNPLLHTRTILAAAIVGSTINHRRTIKNIANSEVPHTRRILPDIVPLFSADVQRPYGRAEKQ